MTYLKEQDEALRQLAKKMLQHSEEVEEKLDNISEPDLEQAIEYFDKEFLNEPDAQIKVCYQLLLVSLYGELIEKFKNRVIRAHFASLREEKRKQGEKSGDQKARASDIQEEAKAETVSS